MSNKSTGREIANMEPLAYMNLMGVNVDETIKNTGVSFTNSEVLKYFKLLREYYLNRIKWTCDTIPEDELRLIEWHIFHYGKCAMLRPRISRNNFKFILPQPKIYQCAYTKINYRNGKPYTISIVNLNAQTRYNDIIIDVEYPESEFVIFTDEFLYAQNASPFINIAWEFACKLHELDLAFNANSLRQRMPFVFNNGAQEIEKDGTFNVIANRGISIAEIMRGAFGRNEPFVEIPQSMVGHDGFMHEPQFVQNHMLEHMDAQKKLYQAYFEMLGLYTLKEKGGTYTVKDVQKAGDETGDFVTRTMLNTRIMCANEAAAKFGINLKLDWRTDI